MAAVSTTVKLISIVVVLFVLPQDTTGVYCDDYYDYFWDHWVTNYEWCTYDCCGYGEDQYCCGSSWDYDNYDDLLYQDTIYPNWTGIIVGSVIGGIVFLSLVIGIPVAVCVCGAKASTSTRRVAPVLSSRQPGVTTSVQIGQTSNQSQGVSSPMAATGYTRYPMGTAGHTGYPMGTAGYTGYPMGTSGPTLYPGYAAMPPTYGSPGTSLLYGQPSASVPVHSYGQNQAKPTVSTDPHGIVRQPTQVLAKES